MVCDEVIIVLFSFQACFINNFLQLRNVFNRVIIDFDRDFLGMFLEYSVIQILCLNWMKISSLWPFLLLR